MKRTKLIKVLERDIRNGKVGDRHLCPVALATRRAKIMPKRYVAVGYKWLDRYEHWKHPPKVATFISRFDFSLPVKPFSFIAVYDGN